MGQVQATDPGGGSVTYALTAGNAAGAFALDATTGILSVAGALPAGGAGLTVTATDAQGGVTRVPVVVAVADAAQERAPPVFPAAGWTFRVAEDAPVGTPVGTAAALDLDGGPLTYALTAGNTGGVFALDAEFRDVDGGGGAELRDHVQLQPDADGPRRARRHGHGDSDHHGDRRRLGAEVPVTVIVANVDD